MGGGKDGTGHLSCKTMLEIISETQARYLRLRTHKADLAMYTMSARIRIIHLGG